MRSVGCKNAEISVIERPTPTPGNGQLLINVLRCGICGSDLHARHHCDELAEVMTEMAINKEIDLRFVVGYTPLEFRDTLQMLAEGKVDPSGMVTGVVGLDGVEAAFGALADPETHAKILIDPASRRARARRSLSAGLRSRSSADRARRSPRRLHGVGDRPAALGVEVAEGRARDTAPQSRPGNEEALQLGELIR